MTLFSELLHKMFLLILFVYVTLAIAKKDIYEEFHVRSAEPDHMPNSMKEYIREVLKSRENFTTCDEFLQDTHFDTTRLLNVTWQVFYLWLEINDFVKDTRDIIANFLLPNTMMVQRFKENLGDEAKNWTAAQLYLETNVGFSCLFLTTNKSGLFETAQSVVSDVRLEEIDDRMALKFVEPHYLGVMNCQYRQLMALAPVGQVPSEREMELVAKQFKFKSSYGISVPLFHKKLTQAEPRRQVYSGEDDRDLSMNINAPDENNLSIF